jgi:hypothetical protein
MEKYKAISVWGGNYVVVHNARDKEDTVLLHRVIFNRMSNLSNNI